MTMSPATRMKGALLLGSLFSLCSASPAMPSVVIDQKELSKQEASTPALNLPKNSEHLSLDAGGKASSASDVCLTKGCVTAAANIIAKMDEVVDPCDDFYHYSCGKFLKTTYIPDEKTSVTMFSVISDELQQKLRLIISEDVTDSDTRTTRFAKNLYKSCMNTTRIENVGLDPLREVLVQMGGWPVVLGDQWDGTNFSWIENTFINRRVGYSVDYLIDFSVSTDVKNSTWRILWLDQPHLGLSREHLMKGLNDSDVQAYLDYLIDIAVHLGAERDRAVTEMTEVLNFQIKLAEYLLPREKRRNTTALYNKMTLSELQDLVPDIDWVEYINAILPKVVQITEDEPIGVSVPSYLTNLTEVIKNTPKRTVANYLMWRAVAATVGYLNDATRDIALTFSRKLTGKNTREPRWKECIGVVSSRLSFAAGNVYAKNFFREDAKTQAEDMVSYIRKEFEQILQAVDWMDDETRLRALEKAKATASYIAYPMELLNDTILDEYYKELEINDYDLLGNVIRLGIFGANLAYGKLRERIDKKDWKRHASAAVVNAFYNSIDNAIIFPAGILQGTFFEPDRPKYLNFGGIGFVIGHEITHGFDDQGKQFNAAGDLQNWWEPETEKRYSDRAQCIIWQYGNYSVPETGLNLNGINTQGENIADNGAAKEARRAYENWVKDHDEELPLPGIDLTTRQLFWVSTGQVWCSKYRPQTLKIRILTGVHSPAQFRVNGALSNSEEFARDWNCPVGSRMNPGRKCTVW